MKTILLMLGMLSSYAAFSQKTIALNSKISTQLPNNAIAFDDKKYKESLVGIYSGESLIRNTKDIYKMDDIIIRIVVLDGDRPLDFIKDQKESSYLNYHSFTEYHSATSSFNGNEQLITDYSIGRKVSYESYIYNIATKKCIVVKMEYPLNDENKKKAEEALTGITKSVVFK
jgi:hypothetical protein